MRHQIFASVTIALVIAASIGAQAQGPAQPSPAKTEPRAQAKGKGIVNPRDPRIPQPMPEPNSTPRPPRPDPGPAPPRGRLPVPPTIPTPNNPQNDPGDTPTNPQDPADDGFTGFDFVGGGYGSSYYEDPARGYADVVRSYGMNHLLNSKATKTYEEARREYLENRLKATKTYFDMRRYNEEARRAERSTPLSMEQYVRLARQQAPSRLSVSQLDPFTGKVSWPTVLQRPEYDEFRGSIDTLFSVRASGAVLSYGEIDKACEQFLAALKRDVETFDQKDYILAKNFVQSLAYESQLVQR